MKSVISIVLIPLLFIYFIFDGSVVYAQNKKKSSKEKITVAVMDFNSQYISKLEAETISQRFRSKLVETGIFTVVEREKMNEILDEQGFQMTGCTDSECIIEAGQMLNVEKMITGFVGKFRDTYTLDARMIDIKTGSIVVTVSRDYENNINKLLADLGGVARKIGGEGDVGKSHFWLWFGAGVLVVGSVVAYLLIGNATSDNTLPVPPLP